MDLLIDSAVGSAMFSFVDGFNGYNHIRMVPKDAKKTAFRTPMGNFYYTMTPFELKNADATYQRAMTVIFHNIMHHELEDYVDNIVVKSKKREEHFYVLKRFSPSYSRKGKILNGEKHSRWPLSCIMMNLPMVQAPIHKKPLLLYMATNSYAIGALIAQEDGSGVEQPGYYISCALRDVEIHYTRAKWGCLAIVYASQRLRHYLLAYKVWVMTKSYTIKTLLQQPIFFGRISQWLLQLSQYDLRMGTPRVVKNQAIANLLAQFPREEEFLLGDEVLGEVAMAEEVREQWIMKFDGSSTTQSGGVGVVLYHEENKAVALSFKLEFSCSNNTVEYEAYLTRLATALEMGVKHLKVLGDSNLVVCQTKGSLSLKEPFLALYRAMAQKMEEKFLTFKIEHAPTNENRFSDALAALSSQIVFEGDSTRVEISKRKESIIETLKERFKEEQCEGDWWIPIKEALTKEGDAAELKILKDYALERGELYRRLLCGILSRCVGQKEVQRKLKEVHDKTCGSYREVNLYCRLQRAGFYWPSMGKEADQVQTQCGTCQLAIDREENYAVFVSED
nr:uncharacterized protein LOC111996740 [Quercus suber]